MTLDKIAKSRMLFIIEKMLDSPGAHHLRSFGNDAVLELAIAYLVDLGAVASWDGTGNYYRTTIHAPAVRRRLVSPRLAWTLEHWFPVAIVSVTALVGVGTIVSNFIR